MGRVLAVVALLVLVLFPFPTATLASSPKNMAQEATLTQRLADLGYTSDLTLRGSKAAANFSFPLPERGITGGTLTLKLTLSQLLSPQSTLQIAFNDRPRLSIALSQLAQDGTLTVPVPAVTEPYLRVRLLGNLLASDDRCVPETDDSLWFVVANSSQFAYSYAFENAAIREFLGAPGGQVVVNGVWDTPQHQGDSIALFSALKHLYRTTPTHVVLAEDASDQPANALRRDVTLSTDAASPPLRLDNTTLTVAAGRVALNELLMQAGQPLLLGRTLNAVETVAVPADTVRATDQQVQQLSLAALGVQDQERSGTGDLSISTRFTLADLGGWPRDLRFVLDTVFDQVPTNTNERAVLRVRLNGTLLDTTDIRGLSSLQRTVALPATLLKAENYLDVVFAYARQSGDCQGAPYAFTGQLRATSGFVWNGYGTGRHVLPELIGSFAGAGNLYLIDPAPEMARATAHLVGGLSTFTTAPLLPTLADSATVAASSKAAYRIIVGGDSALAQTLKLPVDVHTQVTIVDPQTNATLVRGQSDQPLVAAQYLASGTPTLVVQAAQGADAALVDATIKRMIDPQRFFKLDGDVVIGDNDQVLALNLGSGVLENRAPLSAGWQGSLDDYRWLLVVLAAALIAGLWWQIYTRVGRRPPLPTAPNDEQ